MTHSEATRQIARIEAEESADLQRRLAAKRGLDGMIPRRHQLPIEEQARLAAREAVERPILFHRLRKRSRGALTLASGHPDGRLRWVGSILLEGSPSHPRWQATLSSSDPLSDEEMMEDDWWVESYDPLDF